MAARPPSPCAARSRPRLTPAPRSTTPQLRPGLRWRRKRRRRSIARLEEASGSVGAKRSLRLLLAGALPDPRAAGIAVKSVAGGLLAQSRDNAVVDDMTLKVVSQRAPTHAERRDLAFAFRVAKHVKSNAIVYARDCATVGIGAGQMSRVDSARIAARKAEDAAREAELQEPLTKGSVVASDAFFPFADGLLTAIE